jgi:hypothetical protein
MAADLQVVRQAFIAPNGIYDVRVRFPDEGELEFWIEQAIARIVPSDCQAFVVDFPFRAEEGWRGVALQFPYRGPVRVRREGLGLDTPGLDMPLGNAATRPTARLVNGIFWRRVGRERMGQIIQDAADLYWATYNEMPALALVQKIPAGAPVMMTLNGCCDGAVVRLAEADWVARVGVLVCGGLDTPGLDTPLGSAATRPTAQLLDQRGGTG